jgi:hypothetical protein
LILLDLQLYVQSVPITTEVVSSNHAHGEVYFIQLYVIKFVSDLRQVGDFLRLRNTTQVIVRHRICLQTDGHGETSIPPYNFVAGGIIISD